MEQETETYRYPWLRTLFLLVLYAALLIFLWYFPTETGRRFFRTLFEGFLYVGAGLVLVGITFLLFVFIMPVLPSPEVEDEEDLEDFPLEVFPLDVVEARSLAIPALLEPANAATVWDLLLEVSEQFGDLVIITVDEETGIVSVTAPDRSMATRMVRSIRKYMQRSGFTVRKPRF